MPDRRLGFDSRLVRWHAHPTHNAHAGGQLLWGRHLITLSLKALLRRAYGRSASTSCGTLST